jgi:hypothetical protein
MVKELYFAKLFGPLAKAEEARKSKLAYAKRVDPAAVT